MDKKLLSPAQQVDFLRKDKDITFNLINEQDAERFLENKIFLFKLKAFCKNYETYQKNDGKKGKYINLDFGELVELSRLDKAFRDETLNLTLDIEHYLKVRINRGAMKCQIDPYELAASFISKSKRSAIQQQKENLAVEEALHCIDEVTKKSAMVSSDATIDDIVEMANGIKEQIDGVLHNINPNHIADSVKNMLNSPYSKGLAEKYEGKIPPYWCLVELLTFGTTISFYKMCFMKDGLLSGAADEAKTCKDIKNLLRSVQTLRNAAAHNDCLLNSLNVRHRSRSRTGTVRILEQNYPVHSASLSPVKRVPIAVDFSALLVVYDVVVPSGQSRERARQGLLRMRERFFENIQYFQNEDGLIKTSSLRDFFAYLDDLLNVFIGRLEDSPLVLK